MTKTYAQKQQEKLQEKESAVQALAPKFKQILETLERHYASSNAMPLPFEGHKEKWLTLDQDYIRFTAIEGQEQRHQDRDYLGSATEYDFLEEEAVVPTIEKPLGINQIFTNYGRAKEAGRVLIIANAGMGKTTLTHKILYDWANTNNRTANNKLWMRFDFIFRIQLSLIRKESGPISLSDLIVKTLQEEDKDMLQSWTNQDIYYILTNYPNQVLILADGYDEVSTLRYTSQVMEKLKSYPNVVLTSRAEILENDDIRTHFPHRLELIGMAKEEYIYQYIFNYFNFTGERGNITESAPDKAIQLIRAIRFNPAMMRLCTTPLCLYFLCFTIKGRIEQETGQLLNSEYLSLTELYYNLVIKLARRRKNHRVDLESENKDKKSKDVLKDIDRHIRFMALLAYKAIKESDSPRIISRRLYDTVA